MKKRLFVPGLLALSLALLAGCASQTAAPPSYKANATDALTAQLQQDVDDYLSARGSAEHISTAALSVSLAPGTRNIDVSAGTTTYGGSQPVTPQNLFQIASNTKAFTAVALLQLQAQSKLRLSDTVGKWLPEYPAWRDVTITQLLNMTSGIPTYDAMPAWESYYAAHPLNYELPQQLVGYVYPAIGGAGFLYSNTNYILAQMIVAKVNGSYETTVDGVIANAGLQNTFYKPNVYTPEVGKRITGGYFAGDQPNLQPLFGKNVSEYSLSYAQGAGGIVATLDDLTAWARELYEGPMLSASQRAELESLVSMQTGKPIGGVSPDDPSGFGLGVFERYDPKFGTFWYYEGETLGFRVVHIWFPKSDVVIAIGVNSSPSEDKVFDLVASVWETLHAAGKM